MNKTLLGAAQGLDGTADEVLAAGRQDLQPNVVGDGAGGFDQAAGEVKVGLRCRGERDFNLLVAHVHEHLEVSPLLLSILCETVVSCACSSGRVFQVSVP